MTSPTAGEARRRQRADRRGVRTQAVAVPPGFDPAPLRAWTTAIDLKAMASAPDDADAVGVRAMSF